MALACDSSHHGGINLYERLSDRKPIWRLVLFAVSLGVGAAVSDEGVKAPVILDRSNTSGVDDWLAWFEDN